MSQLSNVLDRMLEPLQQTMTQDMAGRFLSLRMDDTTQRRLDDLAERHREGLLTTDEFKEYETIVQGICLISVLQAKARRPLSQPVA